jgi:hypothetical protein
MKRGLGKEGWKERGLEKERKKERRKEVLLDAAAACRSIS